MLIALIFFNKICVQECHDVPIWSTNAIFGKQSNQPCPLIFTPVMNDTNPCEYAYTYTDCFAALFQPLVNEKRNIHVDASPKINLS